MHSRPLKLITTQLAFATFLTFTALTSCAADPPQSAVAPSPLARPAGEPGVGQQQFDSDDQAAAALVAAAKSHDNDALNKMFGPSMTEFVSGDKVEDEKSFDHFVTKAADHLELEKKNGNTSFIDIGNDKWPFPIPLTRLSNGKWFFDTEAGKNEILARRIGSNELQTIKICHGYVDAQREYATEDPDGTGVMKYAQHFISTHGKDGLYWESAPGQPPSPIAQLIAQAQTEGYTPQSNASAPEPYHGYVYRILTSQGPAAPGGPYNYIINDNMIAGFALIASPTQYGTSGVMTFIINQQGKLYQKDLGPKTADVAQTINQYNPDSSWTPVTD
jgi:hypothetical protein